MPKLNSAKIQWEIESLREELYKVVNGQKELLTAEETWQVSHRLDLLIVRYMRKNKKLTGYSRSNP